MSRLEFGLLFLPSVNVKLRVAGSLLRSQGLCKALQELQAQMLPSTEEKPPARPAPRTEDLDGQNLVHKQTRELQVGRLCHHTLVCCDIAAVAMASLIMTAERGLFLKWQRFPLLTRHR